MLIESANVFYLCAAGLFAGALVLCIWLRSVYWDSDEYFHLNHVRAFRETGLPYPEGWTGVMQHNYPYLFHRLAALFPWTGIRAYMPALLEAASAVLVLALTYRYAPAPWKEEAALAAAAMFLFGGSTLSNITFGHRAFAAWCQNAIFVLAVLYADPAAPQIYVYLFFGAGIPLVTAIFLSSKFGYQMLILWMLFHAFLQPEILIVVALGFLLSVLISRGRVFRFFETQVYIIKTYFTSIRRNHFNQLAEPLLLILVPVLSAWFGGAVTAVPEEATSFTVPFMIAGAAVYLSAWGVLNSVSWFSAIGWPFKFFHFAKFPLAVVFGFAVADPFWRPFAAIIAGLEVVLLLVKLWLRRNNARSRTVRELLALVDAEPAGRTIVAYGSIYYPLFHHREGRVFRKKHLPEGTVLEDCLHIRMHVQGKIEPDMNVRWDDGQAFVYEMRK